MLETLSRAPQGNGGMVLESHYVRIGRLKLVLFISANTNRLWAMSAEFAALEDLVIMLPSTETYKHLRGNLVKLKSSVGRD